MIVPSVGIEGQKNILSCKVVIIGAGGLGCPVSLYLVGSGVKYIRIIDDDLVDLSNLHRQVVHTTDSVGIPKVISLKNQLLRLNPKVNIDGIQDRLNYNNAIKYIESYDIIIDCSDNIQTRYLLNDISILLNKPLVSGSAIQSSGQISVFNYNPDHSNKFKGPCYRCLFPIPLSETQSCSDNGVIGPVTGIIGTLQSMETLKVIMKKPISDVLSGKLMMVDAMYSNFNTIKYKRNVNCISCGDNPKITLENFEEFQPIIDTCSSNIPDSSIHSITCTDYVHQISSEKHILLDVRTKTQYNICYLPNSQNIPMNNVIDDITILPFTKEEKVYVICRRGIDSIKVTKFLTSKGFNNVYNIIGGLLSYTKTVDPTFPIY